MGLRRAKAPVTPVSIQGHSVDIMEDSTYTHILTYLRVFLDNKADWVRNTEAP